MPVYTSLNACSKHQACTIHDYRRKPLPLITSLSVALLYLHYCVLACHYLLIYLFFFSFLLITLHSPSTICLPFFFFIIFLSLHPRSPLHLKLIPRSFWLLPFFPFLSPVPNPILFSTKSFSFFPPPIFTRPLSCYNSIIVSSVHSVAINLVNSLAPADPSRLMQLTHTQTAGCAGIPPCSLLPSLTYIL